MKTDNIFGKFDLNDDESDATVGILALTGAHLKVVDGLNKTFNTLIEEQLHSIVQTIRGKLYSLIVPLGHPIYMMFNPVLQQGVRGAISWTGTVFFFGQTGSIKLSMSEITKSGLNPDELVKAINDAWGSPNRSLEDGGYAILHPTWAAGQTPSGEIDVHFILELVPFKGEN